MRCLECNHALDGRTTRCPYCGGNVFGSDRGQSRRDRAAQARSIWDEPRAGSVVPLQPRPNLPSAWMLGLDSALWLAVGILGAWWAGLVAAWATWLALGLALLANAVCLLSLQAAPWWLALWRLLRRPQPGAEAPDSDQAVNM